MTERGRVLAVLAAGTVIFGKVLALREFVMAGAGILVVLGVGAVSVLVRKATVRVAREVKPPRTTAGKEVRVDLRVAVTGRLGPTPLLATDRLPADLGAPVRVALPGAGTERAVSYVMTPKMRGQYDLGPLELVHTDPFGAFRRTVSMHGKTKLVVYPSFEPVSVLPTGVQRLGPVRRSPLLGQGDEFYALRAYEEGDDLRKVHWPSSAKLGALMIRQEELTGEPRALIILDTCGSKHHGRGPTASIEAAVSACASIATLAVRHRMRVDILTPEGSLLPQRQPTVENILEGLAGVELSRRRDMLEAIATQEHKRARRAAVLVLITPGFGPAEARQLPYLLGGTVGGAVVLVDAPSYASDAQPGRGGRPKSDLRLIGLPVLGLRSGQSFRKVWHTGIRDVAVAR